MGFREMRNGKDNSKKEVIISVRIPKWLKDEMSNIDINWSEYIRISIEKRVLLEEMKRIWNKIEDIRDRINRG